MQSDFTRASVKTPTDGGASYKFYASLGHVSKNMSKANWTYLCKHPEIRAIIRVIVTESIKNDVSNFYVFAADLFACSRINELTIMINKQLEWVNDQLKAGAWTPGDGEMLFTEPTDSSTKGKERPSFNYTENDVHDFDCPIMDPDDLFNDNFKPRC